MFKLSREKTIMIKIKAKIVIKEAEKRAIEEV
jgi:hypothetical protein